MTGRKLLNRYMERNTPRAVRVFGLDWTEGHRINNVRRHHAPAVCAADRDR